MNTCKKITSLSVDTRKAMIESDHKELSLRRQCDLLELNRSTLYYEVTGVSPVTLQLMNHIDEIYTAYPFYGSRRIAVALQTKGLVVGRDKVRGLMHNMGLEAIFPKRNLSKANKTHKTYPYLLRGLKISRPNHVWSTDITYIKLNQGFAYLVAEIDWFSRCVLSWRISNNLESGFCRKALSDALLKGKPEIFNTDQGSQFTSNAFTGTLLDANILISMDGKGRALDNIFVERLWRSVKYEDIYIKDYQSIPELKNGIDEYFEFYNHIRPHQSLGYRTPITIYNMIDGPLGC